ncbi:MAG: ASKHA domain-containing protein [Clostridiales Family XIII bacterium]|jgi:uncharacterized 2Fe-2S/4Fe-4S cluster protein (DUF4445 family)|nr:ASKHA domain-containing protein [Clostridiales Family XIII bacterium]
MDWTVRFSELGISAQANDGDNLLDIIRANGIDIAADCGGRGSCGKCVVVANGERGLACELLVRDDMNVTIPRSDDDYDILTDTKLPSETNPPGAEYIDPANTEAPRGATAGTSIAVDIGTTTIVTKLIDLASGRELGTAAALNEQRPYGADVISRINASMDDAFPLSAIITEQVDKMIIELLKDSDVLTGAVRRVVVAGNTTMSYLLLGLPCRSLGLAPFEPAFAFKDEYSYGEIFPVKGRENRIDAPVFVMPFISAYVGGDITAGLLQRESLKVGDGESYILVDMGTNGEIVYHLGERFLCTATAAGPAFEGGNISCGSGSVEGAISKVRMENGAFKCETIGGAPARSVCGSGLLDVMACFIDEGIVDATGAMNADSPYVGDNAVIVADDRPSGGERIALTQKDVREFQLAKSATRSGIETLIGEFGDCVPDKLYLAGGFGQRLDPNSAFTTGLLPESVRNRVEPIGNSSLAGAALAAVDRERFGAAARIAAVGEEINLATHARFNQLFMEHMMF